MHVPDSTILDGDIDSAAHSSRLNMLELDQIAHVLASVSRDRILPLLSADVPLNANQVCRRLGLPISKVRRVRAALRRLAHTGDLLECVSASFPGLRKAAPTYVLLCVPETPPANDCDDNALHEDTEQEPSALLSTPLRPHPAALPRTASTPSDPCVVCRTLRLRWCAAVPPSACLWSVLGRI